MFPVKCAGNIEVLNLYMSDWLLLKKSMIELSISKLCVSIRLKLLFSILVDNSFQGFFFFNSDVFIFRRIFVQLAPNGSPSKNHLYFVNSTLNYILYSI